MHFPEYFVVSLWNNTFIYEENVSYWHWLATLGAVPDKKYLALVG